MTPTPKPPRSPTMPLLAQTTPTEAVHLLDAPDQAPPQPPPPHSADAPAPSGPLRAALEDTRRSWPLVLFHLLILGGTVGYAATATAQPTEAAGLTPELLQDAAGNPWATVVVASLFVASQFIAAWDRSAKVRAADLEAAKLKIELLEKEALVAAKEIAKLEARAELASLREGDAKAAGAGRVDAG